MTSLQDRLRDLGVQVGTSHIPPNQKTDRSHEKLVDVLPGSWEETPAGECFVIRKDFPLDTQHGCRSLYSEPSPKILESQFQLDGLSKLPLSNYLFIDTETTGLAGGTGTYVFLIGAAKIIDDRIHFAQFFLQDPEAESAQLAALENYASSSNVIISYNGKSFDLPRIRTRYNLHGWPDPFSDIYHLDLLHIARRLWKDSLPSCTLGDLEYHLLKLERDELDIPGWKVAEYFFSYLQDGDPYPLKHILYHNEIDVLSLVSLLGYISERLSFPLDAQYASRSDLIPVGKFLASSGETQKAIEVLSHALHKADLSQEQRIQGCLELASIHKRNDFLAEALPLWEESAQIGSLAAKIELAKFYEHQQNDYAEAIHWTLSALEGIPPAASEKDALLRSDLEHRLNRLKKKAKR
jgi:hypothetical protein